jgi:hypothetical protein
MILKIRRRVGTCGQQPPAAHNEAVEDQPTPVEGTVHLMTDEPLAMPGGDPGELRERVAEAVNRRPWLVPAVLIAVGAAFLLLRRRR